MCWCAVCHVLTTGILLPIFISKSLTGWQVAWSRVFFCAHYFSLHSSLHIICNNKNGCRSYIRINVEQRESQGSCLRNSPGCFFLLTCFCSDRRQPIKALFTSYTSLWNMQWLHWPSSNNLFIYLLKRDSVHERTCQTRKRARFSSRNYFSSVIIPIIQLFAGCSCSPVLNRADQTNCLLPSGSVNTDVCIRMEHPFIILHQSSCSVFSRGCRCGVYKVLHRTRKERK